MSQTHLVLFGALALGLLSAGTSRAQHQPHDTPHGTPSGWKLRWPPGDPGRGRDVFVKLECFTCHEVRGQDFSAPSQRGRIGPELSQMGPLHEPEYFAEAIINPSATIEPSKGYEAADGSSKMPSYNDSVTVQEVIDLVAYLRSLKPAAGPGTHDGHNGG